MVGRVTGAHGIRGGLKIHSFAESMDLYHIGAAIWVNRPDGSAQTMTVVWARPHGRGLRLGFESVDDRTHAERLVGSTLYIEKSCLPVLEEDTYYWHELVGLRVFDTMGNRLGRLDEIISTPAHDVYVVNGEIDGQGEELLIPAIATVVHKIDLEGGTMVVDPPEGL